ncbi:SAM-dependent methyltransferase [Shewanella japonica]|uniref:SAM-dependent methyltransferase n=1 Tax=Shewanella japonica TaxID=93973 RepID=A0ABM6JH01_9GAMM|nr:SAM-dependent methyltransferase [Shewanella japonica]ARD21517.1 SAM-dependent methyltransferase [Shewanella japonica]
MDSILVCPICAESLQLHEQSQGYYCNNKHHIDKNAQGYWSFVTSPKFKGSSESRQQLRAKRFLKASGILSPLVKQVSNVFSDVAEGKDEVNHLNYQCNDGFYIRSLSTLSTLSTLSAQAEDNVTHWGVSEADNALFAASKDTTPANLLLTPFKKLPFKSDAIDIVTVFEAQLKGKECLRVLKPDGALLLLVPGARHLWQLKQKIYQNLLEKPQQLNLPKDVEIINTTEIKFNADVSGEQAITLLDMNNLSWRVNDELAHQIKQTSFEQLEFDYVLLHLKKR